MDRYEYKQEQITIEHNSKLTLIDKLNELGSEGWEVISISVIDSDKKLSIGSFRIHLGIVYDVLFKRKVD